MKITNLLLSIIIILLASFISCENNRRIQFANNIKSHITTLNKPAGIDVLVKKFEDKLTILSYTLTLKELNEVQGKFDLTDSLMNQIRTAPYARVSGAKQVGEKTQNIDYTYEETIGAALKEDDEKISFALIKTKSLADLIPLYENYTVKECHTFLFFFEKCHDEPRTRRRPLTQNEKTLINQGAKFSAVNSLLKAVEILKRDDYELYMSDTGSIFSPDKKSLAHVTYFGDIAIGPVSELNSILPLQYYYKPLINSDIQCKTLFGDVNKIFDYPKSKKNQNKELIFNAGAFHKFDFIVNNCVSRFPREYANYMEEKSKNGPFVLEVKKNGNVILYEEKTKKTIWETKTANKGQGPYSISLTNDKQLILEDSNKNIIYKSPKYKGAPSIYYGDGKEERHVSNGLILQFPAYIWDPKDLHIVTDDDKTYKIQYGGMIFESGRTFTLDNFGGYNENKVRKSQVRQHLATFFAKFENTVDYFLCYSGFSLVDGVWSEFNCDEEEITGTLDRDDYLTSIIIYVRRKCEADPVVNNN